MKNLILAAVIIWTGTTIYSPTTQHRVVYEEDAEQFHAEYLGKDSMGVDGWHHCYSFDEDECYRQALKDLLKKQHPKTEGAL
jgi:hypothetical protein